MLPLEDSIKKEKTEERVYLIAGVINATGKMLFWKNEENIEIEIEIGDYAVVENMNGYDLVKVVGTVITTKAEASKFSNTKYNNMKKAVLGIEESALKNTNKVN